MRYNYAKLLIIPILLLTACTPDLPVPDFDGSHAMQYAQTLINFGYRTPGSDASSAATDYISKELSEAGWQVEYQEFIHKNVPLRNIIAKNTDSPADVLIGTHYDTRQISDEEENTLLRSTPVPGANDGTSGTAVLMELARSLENSGFNIHLVFFDGEDQGRIDDWDWSVGAQYYADHLESYPENVIIIDMIGDADLNIYMEKNSDHVLTQEIWDIADSLGYGSIFINSGKYSMIDDHLPFIDLGIPACLLIDFDYPYWHTQADTLDKISAESLDAVGSVLIKWLDKYPDR